jgi:hypothetical protein
LARVSTSLRPGILTSGAHERILTKLSGLVSCSYSDPGRPERPRRAVGTLDLTFRYLVLIGSVAMLSRVVVAR